MYVHNLMNKHDVACKKIAIRVDKLTSLGNIPPRILNTVIVLLCVVAIVVSYAYMYLDFQSWFYYQLRSKVEAFGCRKKEGYYIVYTRQ